MSKKKKTFRPKARVAKGLRDIGASEVRAVATMLAKISDVYEAYGFEPLDTPAFEYSDALGKFLPDSDRPNEGVFSFQDEDEQWLSLRYDLTAPLARFVAENYDPLPKPFRRYQSGTVWRNEKPGPGRYRQFIQCDADTVASPNVAADAELCMMAADCLEALGISRGDYKIRVNNRKVLDGVLEKINIDPSAEETALQRLTILRAIDKLDRLGSDGVMLLLGEGRKDESGDFTKGAGLDEKKAQAIIDFTQAGNTQSNTIDALAALVGESELGLEGVAELRDMQALFDAAGYEADRILIDPSVVRGLGYYTGPVFEAELTFETKDEKGNPVNFGSVGGGGRYDGLIERFKGIKVPATGFSIGVSRLYTALDFLGRLEGAKTRPPVVVLVMDPSRFVDSQKMAFELRTAGIRAEAYMGGSGMRAQMKYADKRGAPCVVIEGEDEKQAGEITIKDLALGEQMSASISDNKEWRETRPAQVTVPRSELVAAVKNILDSEAG